VSDVRSHREQPEQGVADAAPQTDIGSAAKASPAYRLRGVARDAKSTLPWWARYGVFLTLAALIVIFALTTQSFFDAENFRIVSGSNGIAAILAMAALLPLIVGEFDLSVGANLELSGVVVAVLVGEHGMPLAEACVLAVLLTSVIGAINGAMIAYVGVSSFVATLAMSSVVAGLSLNLTNGALLFQGIPDSLKNFAQGNVVGLPYLAIVAVLATVLLWYITEHTPLGRRLTATGLNREAARLMGVRVRRLIFGSFVASGALAGIAGVLFLGRIGSAVAGAGPNFLLPALTAGFLGATAVKVGRFNVAGTLIAVALVAVGLNGLQLNGAPAWVEPVFNGGILLAAIAASQIAVLRSGR
jgi:ribose transport system permease protein